MSRKLYFGLPALALLAACNNAPADGTSNSAETEAVPADEGATTGSTMGTPSETTAPAGTTEGTATTDPVGPAPSGDQTGQTDTRQGDTPPDGMGDRPDGTPPPK